MAGSIFGISTRPTAGQGVIWSETLGGRMDVGADSQPASQLTGLTLNRVPFGNSLGGLQDSANLTFDGSTLTLTGAQSISGQLTSSLATGTAPFSIASTTVVPNLNVSQLLGSTWAAPGTIGSGTPSTGAFTTLSATGAITSTLATGTAPFTVASTTVVANLNVSQLLGSTWASPGTIGSSAPSTGAFTTLTASGATTVTDATDASSSSTGCLVLSGGLGIAKALNVGTSATIGASATINSLGVSLTTIRTDATNLATTASCVLYQRASSGTPAAGFGTNTSWQAHSANNTMRAQGDMETSWVVATDASRTSRMTFYARDSSQSRECFRIESSGTAAMIGFLGASAAVRYATTGTSTGFTAGAGTTVTHLSTFTGNSGSTAYTIADIVLCLKTCGLMAA